jgi:hypothetical protein
LLKKAASLSPKSGACREMLRHDTSAMEPTARDSNGNIGDLPESKEPLAEACDLFLEINLARNVIASWRVAGESLNPPYDR